MHTESVFPRLPRESSQRPAVGVKGFIHQQMRVSRVGPTPPPIWLCTIAEKVELHDFYLWFIINVYDYL